MQQTEGEKNVLQKELIQSQKALLEISNQRIKIGLNEKDCLESSLRQSEIYQLFHQAAHQAAHQEDKLKSISEESWKQLQTIIDTTYHNFTEQLYALSPKLSEHDLRICYLIKIRIQTKDITKILCRTLSAISNSRVRLYKKIHGVDGTSDMFDKFILDL
ncbi:MAG: hypothetical protein LUD46_12900 [Parabacteroides sp.]|nr:hypothetical protein [Parabacteroides sp.]